MSKIRPSTQLMQDGAVAGDDLVWDDVNKKWVPSSLAPAVPTADANLIVQLWMEP